MRPIIGITPQYDPFNGVFKLSPFYSQAVEAAGGIPFVIPYSHGKELTEATARSIHGIIFSGGNDISPHRYNEGVSSQCGIIEYERDEFELTLCKYAEENDVPVLGICRGCQLIAISAGGTLCQYVDGHMQQTPGHVAHHTVSICKDSPLYIALKEEQTNVNSFHRQYVKTPGRLKIAATDKNGVTEAVYHPDKSFFVGVQWHPERMYPIGTHSRSLFKLFISSCR